MPLITTPKPPSGGQSGGSGQGGLLTTRRGTVLAAGIVALLAGLVLLFALQQYRGAVADDGEAAKVLVANALIAQGSSGDVLPTEDLVKVAEVRADQLEEGALTDPSALRGQVASREILPNQQLTEEDFTISDQGLQTKLAGTDRGIGVPVEAPQAVAGQLRTGDRVDVHAALEVTTFGAGANRPVVKTLMQNVLVLRGSGGEEESKGGDEKVVVLRVSADSAADLAFASENGKVWLALRPGAGAEDPKKELVTLESFLTGKRPEWLTGGERDR